MPYSFTEIEKAKSWIIGLVFFILILIYFAAAWTIASVFRLFYLKSSHLLLSPGESLLVLLIALLAGVIIVYIILAIVVGLSNLLKMFISRQREYRADAVAIRLTRDPLGLAEALYVISRNWRGAGIRGEGLAPLFILNPKYHHLDESEGLVSALFSTHPPIKTRIDIALNIAHASPDDLDNALKKKIKPVVEKEEAPLVLAKGKKSWLIYRDGKWEGPWPIEAYG